MASVMVGSRDGRGYRSGGLVRFGGSVDEIYRGSCRGGMSRDADTSDDVQEEEKEDTVSSNVWLSVLSALSCRGRKKSQNLSCFRVKAEKKKSSRRARKFNDVRLALLWVHFFGDLQARLFGTATLHRAASEKVEREAYIPPRHSSCSRLPKLLRSSSMALRTA